MKMISQSDRIVALDEQGTEMGFIAWTILEDGVLQAHHTFVDPKFRGQGVAGHLLKEMVSYARKNNKKIFATCSYVVKMFSHGDEYKDVIDPKRGVGDASCRIN